jgi:chemotaxis protein CheX
MSIINSEDIVSITQSILSTMLQLEASPAELTPTSDSGDRITGCVQISGEWRGAVVVQSSETLAKLFASRLLATPISDLTHADLLDAFAEMTNMIGGNIKGQVPAPSSLSIPSVTTGHDFQFHLAGATVIRDVNLACELEELRVLLCEETPTTASRAVDRKQAVTA